MINIASEISAKTYKHALNVGFRDDYLMRSLLTKAAKQNRLRAYVLYAGGEPCAFEYGIEYGIFVMFGYPGEELEDIYDTIEFVRDLQPDHYLTTVAYPLRGTKLFEEIQDQIIYPSGWTDHLQRELEINNRFIRPLYSYAIKKTASEYRKRQLSQSNGNKIKQAYHKLRSVYCDYRIKQLVNVRTG